LTNFLSFKIEEGNVLPCYFFHGEETFLAYLFVQELKKSLISSEVENYNVEKFNLEENSWMEIIDVARTAPFFFSSWRIIVVELTGGKKDILSSTEKSILKDYLTSPSSQTVMVIIYSGKIKKSSSLFKLFSSLASSQVGVKELKPLKKRFLSIWIDKKLSLGGKSTTPEAKTRLEELVGGDLRRINNELEKLITFVGDRKIIELDDVNQISGWVKSFVEWEIADSLEKGDLKQSFLILDSLLKEGVKPELVVGIISRFFRDLLLAKLWLWERQKDRKDIFKEIKPNIQERFGQFYRDKFRIFFSLVDKLSFKELNHFLNELGKIDLKIKTSDASAQILLESFLYDYCDLSRRGIVTWKERG